MTLRTFLNRLLTALLCGQLALRLGAERPVVEKLERTAVIAGGGVMYLFGFRRDGVYFPVSAEWRPIERVMRLTTSATPPVPAAVSLASPLLPPQAPAASPVHPTADPRCP